MDLKHPGFLMDDADSAYTFARCLVSLLPVLRQYSFRGLYMGNEVHMHDITDSWSLATLKLLAPPLRKLPGFDNVMRGLTYNKFDPKSLNIEELRKLELMVKTKSITKAICYGHHHLAFTDEDNTEIVKLDKVNVVDDMITSELCDFRSRLFATTPAMGPHDFTECERAIACSGEPLRVCVDLNRAWIEDAAPIVPSVRFILFAKQLVPLKDVESSVVEVRCVDYDKRLYNVCITRRNRWLQAIQTFNVYHFYRRV
jgi:hypothetical protein